MDHTGAVITAGAIVVVPLPFSIAVTCNGQLLNTFIVY
jgi:uncharacterized protein (DUF697 family)